MEKEKEVSKGLQDTEGQTKHARTFLRNLTPRSLRKEYPIRST